MLADYLPTRLRIQYWLWSQERASAAHAKKIKLLRKKRASPDDIEQARNDAHYEGQDFEGTIMVLQTELLIRQLSWLMLPYPGEADWDEVSPPFYYRHLKREAIARIRKDIDEERERRWKIRLVWLPLVTALTGLIGTIIGLISVWQKSGQ